MIRSGERHYSEMIGPEDAPTRERMKIFRQCLNYNGDRMARDVCILADAIIASTESKQITLVSIARAGTPIGVLLLRRIRDQYPNVLVAHYSISIIRDWGIDQEALRQIIEKHPLSSIRFIDGWTGKGTIADELENSLISHQYDIKKYNLGLWTPLDICGAAQFAASSSDYIIPSSLLGGTISGLISRSVLLEENRGKNSLHGCVSLSHLKKYDITRWFIENISDRMSSILVSTHTPCNASGGSARREEAIDSINQLMIQFDQSDRNRIKTGIGETIRVLLRRKPRKIILNERLNQIDSQIISDLANTRGVDIVQSNGIKFDAVAVISDQ